MIGLDLFPTMLAFKREHWPEQAGEPRQRHPFYRGAQRRHYRSIWLSDIHLGSRGCKADFLLDFLKHVEADYIYLVGDIIDGWSLKQRWYWPQAHTDVINALLARGRDGSRLVYLPGNHDEDFRDYVGLRLGNLAVAGNAVHRTADGRRFLVTHGDQFDVVVENAKWVALAGDKAYTALLAFNTWFNAVRRRLGFPYWSISAFIKHKVKMATAFIGDYETVLVQAARNHEVDGVICGHIHHAEMRNVGGIVYCNTGDWVESCSAVVEHETGELEIINWADMHAETAAGMAA